MERIFTGGKFRWVFMACGLVVAVAVLSRVTLLPVSAADNTICAKVKIEVKQELALERQAFEAHMHVNNGLAHLALEDIVAEVSLTDADGSPVPASSDPGNTGALFFIRLDSIENIDDITGSGSISPATAADIRWLIIPAPGSADGLQQGKLYYVGAKLTYTIGGVENVTAVTPDYIFVKPLPNLALDYFLPHDIFGDDAFTTAIEPPVPFSLGVRVSNVGGGFATNLKIDSAQPKIVENTQGLQIGFAIAGSEVNGNVATNSLLVDFGDIEPAGTATARWIMSCTLSGQFISFDTRVSHSDELGGELTSLVKPENICTHTLVQDVLVDLPGRDRVRDFLSRDDDVLRVYETDSADAPVRDHSAISSLVFLGQDGERFRYALQTPITAGFIFVRLPDPAAGRKVIAETRRSDGKTIKPENIWLSKIRNGEGWEHFINLFDVNTTGVYSFALADSKLLPQAPLLDDISDRSSVENQGLTFQVSASDPNGTVPALAAEQLPAGAVLHDQGDGKAVFNWTPFIGQAGRYEIVFTATDGALTDSRRAVLTINTVFDSDGDGMHDAWEMEKFGDLARDGRGDFDGDGIGDFQEFLLGSDPVSGDHAPSVPVIEAPMDGSEVATLQPQLAVANSSDADGDSLTYQFELYGDQGYSELVAGEEGVPQGDETTTWTVPVELTENRDYYWRVRTADGYSFSLWAYGMFVVNSFNDPPGVFFISRPRQGAVVGTVHPLLEVTNSRDPDPGFLTYGFEVFADSDMRFPLATASGILPGAGGITAWGLETDLIDGKTYYWQATAADELGVRSQTAVGSFTVDLFHPEPPAPVIVAPLSGMEVAATDLELTVSNVSHGASVDYFFELDVAETFDTPFKIASEGLSAGVDEITAWPVAGLSDGVRYFWRVRVGDGAADSAWTAGRFLINAKNETPSAPTVRNPGRQSWVNDLTPELAVNPALDPDGDDLTYQFEIYTDEALTIPAYRGGSTTGSWRVPVELSNNTRCFWRARAEDDHGAVGEWTTASAFFVRFMDSDEAPGISILSPVEAVVTNGDYMLIQWEDVDPDSSARIALYYDTDTAGADGVLIAGNLAEDPDGAADSYEWDITALEGVFYLYATITDDQNETTVYSPVPVTIDRSPPEIVFVPPGGSYTTALSVTLSADEAAAITCTLDGSEPTAVTALYSTPIDIAASTILKCRAVDAAGNAGPVVSGDYTIGPARLTLTVGTDKGRALSGVKVYAFTAAGSFTGKSALTDADGAATFDPVQFAADDYKFRADYLGSQFWSVPLSLPENLQAQIVIEEESTEITVRFADEEAEGVKVYLFTAAGGYLGTSQVTDRYGRASYILPVGIAYSFRADILGSRYWSLANTIVPGAVNSLALDAGGGSYRIMLRETEEAALAGIRLYLFNQAGSYLGQYRTTLSDGTADFTVPSGTYTVRADYCGYQFWSDETDVATDTTVTFEIPHRDVTVAVSGTYQDVVHPLEGIKVYLFTESGSYQGIQQTTGLDGTVTYRLPQKLYKVRADYLGRKYWSGALAWDDPALLAEPEVRIAMADAEIVVTGGGFPVAGEKVYVFTPDGSYVGLHQATDPAGKVIFRLPADSYKFRVDHQGGRFWSGEQPLAADSINPVGISTGGGSHTLTVRKSSGDPLSGINCFAFTAADAYLNMFGTTNDGGRVAFDLAAGRYKFRVDYLGNRLWSGIADIPDDTASGVTVPHETVEVAVLTGCGPAAGQKVFLFTDGGAYLGLFEETDTDGKAFFSLPANFSFQFRADILGRHFWSNRAFVKAGVPNAVSIDAGGGAWQVTVREQAGVPMTGIELYLFDQNDGYLGVHRTTGPDGRASFDVPEGSYKVRADHLGHRFWSTPLRVTESTGTLLSIAHRRTHASIRGVFQGTETPLAGVRVQLYSPTDTYLGIHATTDSDGKISFDLPQKDYKVRTDILGGRYFSELFNWSDVTVAIPMADAAVTVTGGGLPLAGRKIFVYSEDGAYLGESRSTDDGGMAIFRLPAATYKFRVDYQGSRYWSAVQAVEADRSTAVVLSVGGGAFAFTVEKSAGIPLAGAKCYVFSGSGAYIGLSGATNEQGRVFFDLAAGQYTFRVDHLGYHFWSDEFDTAATLAGVLALDQQAVTVTVQGHYLSSEPLEGLKVHLFTPAGAYLGRQAVTDGKGEVHFSLPDKDYQVRVDTHGNRFWSEVFRQAGTTVTISQGRTTVQVFEAGTAVEGAKVYLFSESGAYLSQVETTNAGGRAEFILPNRTFKFRVDKGAGQVWSEVVNVPAGASADVTVDL